jgi:RND family efflux transporter MFP subunit
MKTSILIFTCSLLVVLLSGCKKKDTTRFGAKLGEIGAKADPVKVEGRLMKFGDFSIELVSNGKLEAVQKASLNFRKSGLVREIFVKDGQWVQASDPIASLYNEMEDLELQQSALRLERARLNRLDRIISYKVGARKPEDISPEALKQINSETGFEEAELAFRQAGLLFDYTNLKAPFSGRIASLESRTDNVPDADKPFCILINDREFDVVFPVLEDEMDRLTLGQQVSVVPFALDSLSFTGMITVINPLVDEHGLVRVKARIANIGGRLVEGMNVKVFIRFRIPGCLIIPKEALVLRNNRQVVFSLNNGRSYWNYVQTGLENSSSYTINIETGILKPGDTIITKGNLNLAHDAELELTFMPDNK